MKRLQNLSHSSNVVPGVQPMALYGEISSPFPLDQQIERGALVRSWLGSKVSRPAMPDPLTPTPHKSSSY